MPELTAENSPAADTADVRAYIEEMLAELAELAASRGERRLATTLRIVALEAARQPERA